MDYFKMSYNQLRISFEKGILDPYDLMDVYKKARGNVLRQVNKIDKSDVPFITEDRPDFAKPSEISNTGDLIKAFADLNEFRKSPYYTISNRRAIRDKSLATMETHGMNFVNKDNYTVWAKFMKWFRANKLNKLYGSQDDVVENFFEDNWEELEKTPSSEWENLFNEYTEGM